MNTLVTGGAGFIGSHLVDALVQRGDRVRVLDNLEPQVHRGKHPGYLHPKADYLFESILNQNILPQALEGIEAIVHLAALVGVGQSMYQVARYMEVNTLGTARFLEFLINQHRKPLARFVVASSMSIYGEGLYRCPEHGNVSATMRSARQLANHAWEATCPRCGAAASPLPTPEEKPLMPTSIYAISKRDQEELSLTMGQAYHLPVVALRFFNVYGPRQSLSNPYTGACAIFSSRLRHGKSPILYEDGKQTRDFIHVSDLVQGILVALDHPQAVGQALNVGTGKASSIHQVALSLAQAYGVKIPPTIVGRYRAGDIRHCFADISRISDLGFRPRMTLDDGLKDLVRWGSTAETEDLFDVAERELVERHLLGD